MKALSDYLSVLDEIQNQTGAKISYKKTSSGLVVNGQPFYTKQDADSRDRKAGVIVEVLSKKASEELIASQRSYLTSTGDLYLSRQDARFQIHLKKVAKKRVAKKSKPTLSPTLIISPNGLSIVDSLIQCTAAELKTYPSALSFVKEFELSQAKLSQTMTALKANSISALKEKILALPVDWWGEALRYPMTRKRMTPFYEVAESYYGESESWIHIFEELGAESANLVRGPMNVAYELGLIRNKEFGYWADQETADRLKRKYRLIPGTREGLATCYFATSHRSLKEEAVISGSRLNELRSVWDMGFGDERMREIQVDALRKVLGKAKK
jgi:hypothetical protein